MLLEETLKSEGIDHEKLLHPRVFTAQQLAEAEHVSGYRVAKPVIVRGGDRYAMFVLTAPFKLDLDKAARIMGDESVRLATEEEMSRLFPECEIGAEPPIGKLFKLATYADEHLRDDDLLVMQSGSHTEAMRLRREDWEDLCRPKYAKVAMETACV